MEMKKKKKKSYSIPKVYLAEDWVSLRAMVSFKERYRGRESNAFTDLWQILQIYHAEGAV